MPFLLYALVTWTTRDRGPLITVQVEAFLRKTLAQIAHRHGAAVLAMGIVDDHVHLLVRLPARFDVPRLVPGCSVICFSLVVSAGRLALARRQRSRLRDRRPTFDVAPGPSRALLPAPPALVHSPANRAQNLGPRARVPTIVR